MALEMVILMSMGKLINELGKELRWFEFGRRRFAGVFVSVVYRIVNLL